jgi:hypothetical protein
MNETAYASRRKLADVVIGFEEQSELSEKSFVLSFPEMPTVNHTGVGRAFAGAMQSSVSRWCEI